MNLLKKRLVTQVVLMVFLSASIGLVPVDVSAQATSYNQQGGRGATNFGDPEPDAWDVAGDGLFVRPINMLLTGLGSAIFLATLPFSLMTGDADKAAEKLIQEPAHDFVDRCFGCVRQGKRWNPRKRWR